MSRNIVANLLASLESLIRNVRKDYTTLNNEAVVYTAANILNRLVELRNRISRILDEVVGRGEVSKYFLELLKEVDVTTLRFSLIALAIASKTKMSKNSSGAFSSAVASAIFASLLNYDDDIAKTLRECLEP